MAKRNDMNSNKKTLKRGQRLLVKMFKHALLSVVVFGGLWVSYILTPPTNIEKLRKLSTVERPAALQPAPLELEIEQIHD